MRFAKNRVCEHSYSVIVAFLMKYPKLSFLFVLFVFLAFSTWLLARGLCSHHSQMIYPLFHTDSPVKDIHNGSMDALHNLMLPTSIVFVMYYAHWCGQSTKLVYEFHRTSKKFKGQVSFIAINCWMGSCQQQNFLHLYPQLFLYHTKFEAVPYNGPHRFKDMVNFVQQSLRPLTYVSSQIVLKEFLDPGKPLLLGFFNGTNYQNKNYNEFFGSALRSINTVSGLQFGVITATPLATLLGLKRFGQVVLVNALNAPKVYPQGLNYNCTSLIQWAEQEKVEYVQELDPGRMEAKTFGQLIKARPSLILFVPMDRKDTNMKILHLYHQAALSYRNCSCAVSEPSPNATEDSADEPRTSPRGCHDSTPNGHVTSCQSLAVSHVRGMQNSCDVCRECYAETCLCADTSFPLRTSTFSVFRNFALPRNSCRSLRKNSYREKNALRVCCFDSKTRATRESFLLNLEKSRGQGTSETVEAGLDREEHLKILAEKFETLNMEVNPSDNKQGMFHNLFGNLMKIFQSPQLGPSSRKGSPQSESASHLPEYQEFGTCERRGKVRVFVGASCYSNMTVNFYVMDSRKHWNYALAFGVKARVFPRLVLVLVDSKNEAQYVLPEETPLNNATIVNFVMNFMNGILTRRLRSAPVPKQSCLAYPGCLTEVVSRTFTQLVLDKNKDVFLMYYTPWCGFCKSVKPALISLVGHYKHSPSIRIARLNADLNDLPWEYTVEKYPSFIFFPARRKDFSVKFPENEQRTLENFIKFVEKHRTGHVIVNRKRVAGSSHVRMYSLQRNLNDLKRQNLNLRRRLHREIIAKQNAEKGRLTAEQKISALLDERDDDSRARFDFKSRLRELSSQNAELLREILSAKEQLSKYRKIAERTVEELRQRNWELHATIVSLEEENLLVSQRPRLSHNNKT